MTPEQTQRSTDLARYRVHAEEHEAFRAKWRPLLLTDYAPRIARLKDANLERALGNALVALSVPWVPSMSHLDKCADRCASTLTDQILCELLAEDVARAEAARR